MHQPSTAQNEPGWSYNLTAALACGGPLGSPHASPPTWVEPCVQQEHSGEPVLRRVDLRGLGQGASLASPSHTHGPQPLVASLLVTDAGGRLLGSQHLGLDSVVLGANRTVALGVCQRTSRRPALQCSTQCHKTGWFSNAWIDVYALTEGERHPTRVQIGGMGALHPDGRQEEGGPNPPRYRLNRQAANSTRWGQYWVYVTAREVRRFTSRRKATAVWERPHLFEGVASPRSSTGSHAPRRGCGYPHPTAQAPPGRSWACRWRT
jgi:hypothetical protein